MKPTKENKPVMIKKFFLSGAERQKNEEMISCCAISHFTLMRYREIEL